MAKKDPNGNDRNRQVVAQEAARIIVDQGIRDYRVAKMKAAERLGLTTRGSLPRNAEIERAITEHHQIFGGEEHADLLRAVRVLALGVMQRLQIFTPRLVGPVLTGTADENSAINLHLFADDAFTVSLELDAMNIPYRAYERRLKSRRNVVETYPGFQFKSEHTAVQATVFPVDGIRQAPLSPIDGRPMDRADATRVQGLIDDEPA